MLRAYKYRIYPNKIQKEQLSKTFGCTRYVYNYYLDKKIKGYENGLESFFTDNKRKPSYSQ